MTQRLATVRAILILILIVGVIAALFAIVRYAGAASDLANSPSLEQMRATLDLQNPTNAQILVVTESLRREAVDAQTQSLIIGGLALVAIGAGWLGLDTLNRHLHRTSVSSANPPPMSGA